MNVAGPSIGRTAPLFCLKDQKKKDVCLKDLKGKWVVLYFYPKDLTPGCTTEAIGFTSARKEFDALGAVILGVSPDDAGSHCKFIEKKGLDLTLLSDPEFKTLEAYGVWKMKSLYGKTFLGVDRSTFIIDPEGVLREKWTSVSVGGHVETVLDRLKELKG